MKRIIFFLLAVISLISCREKNNANEHVYSPEFLSGFIKDKNSLLSQQNTINEESDRLDIITLDVLQSGPKFLPFSMELLNMKRNKLAVKESVFRNFQKLHAISDEIILKQKDQATLEKEWTRVKRETMESASALQIMNADNEKRFREFTTMVTGQPSQPSGPRMPIQQPPPPVR